MDVTGIKPSAAFAALPPKKIDWVAYEIPSDISWASDTVRVFHPLLAFATRGHSFCVYNIHTQEMLYRCGEGVAIGRDLLNIYQDGSCLISQANGGPSSGADVKIWNREDGQRLACLEGCITFVISGDQIFSGRGLAWDKFSLVVWNKLTGEVMHVLDPSESSHFLLADDTYFFAGMKDGTIKAWLKHDGSLAGSFQHDTPAGVTALIGPHDSLISGHENGSIRIWNKETHQLSHEFMSPDGKVRRLEIRGDILMAQSDKALHAWNIARQTHLYSIQDVSCYVCEGELLYTGSATGTIEGRNIHTQARLCELTSLLGGPVFKLVITGDHLFCIIREKGVELWNRHSCLPLRTFEAEGNAAVSSNCVAISSEGKIKLWTLSAES
jgi:WD40 repeat protein